MDVANYYYTVSKTTHSSLPPCLSVLQLRLQPRVPIRQHGIAGFFCCPQTMHAFDFSDVFSVWKDTEN